MFKLYLFIIFLFGIGKLIDCNYLLNIPKEIYSEFVYVFFITLFSYFIIHKILDKFVLSFKKINPEHKKMYVVKNYIKSFFLACLCYKLDKFSDLLNGNLDLMFIKRCAIYYIMNDILGLIIVKKLPLTTKIHHITTSLCGFAIIMKKSNNLDVLSLIVLYAVFSSIAFCVNFYLGLRIYSSDIKLKRYMSNISFWTYLLSCIVNWILQIFLATKVFLLVPIYHTIFYFIFLYSVGKDDIILMKWLYDDHIKFKKIMNDNKLF
jgi:hypothetical protein